MNLMSAFPREDLFRRAINQKAFQLPKQVEPDCRLQSSQPAEGHFRIGAGRLPRAAQRQFRTGRSQSYISKETLRGRLQAHPFTGFRCC
ncbi:hypothetical protein HNE_0743 [Hyphomonas neptunium ATCC 15444]|uniref:Uncharacterized protein n=1 Tax=Hyphomonas neptunium (strain ATCC 15444) TaxID=228405 RepID=Q0C472_HYPNA|nr:hypothetical protein HNE_0743 [Hyphomonas neptunium ATCC 15444]